MSHAFQRRDANEPPIIETLRGVGAYVKQMQREDGFDLLVVFRDTTYMMEVKRPENRADLTSNEWETMASVQSHGGAYVVVTTELEALAAIGANAERTQ